MCSEELVHIVDLLCPYYFIYIYRLSYPSSDTGILACLDGYMNIAMEQTEEYVNGQLKNKYGDAFIRGNNGKYQLFDILLQNENGLTLISMILFC